MSQRFLEAKEIYQNMGIDVEQAISQLQNFPVSMHCWQGDDVVGFDGAGSLSGGIQTTGNYPGKARNPKELMDDIDMALKLIPGKNGLIFMHRMLFLKMVKKLTVMLLT